MKKLGIALLSVFLVTSALATDLRDRLMEEQSFVEAHVNKFGRAPNGVQTTATDIWDRADATPTQQLWVPPTQGRNHTLVSDAAGDDELGQGCQEVTLYGLQNWTTGEVSEVVTMDGTTGVLTDTRFVIIYRMICTDYGTVGPNVGTITATAQIDGTVTAQINPGEGQTQMAIWACPTGYSAYMTGYYSAINRTGPSRLADIVLKVAIDPASHPSIFTTKHTMGLQTTGSSILQFGFDPVNKISCPAIIKLQSTSTVADTDMSAGFNLRVVKGP